MEVVMAVIAVAVAGSCLFFLTKSDLTDYLARRKLARQEAEK